MSGGLIVEFGSRGRGRDAERLELGRGKRGRGCRCPGPDGVVGREVTIASNRVLGESWEGEMCRQSERHRGQ